MWLILMSVLYFKRGLCSPESLLLALHVCQPTRLCVLSHFRTVQHFSSSDACSCIFIIFIVWRKPIAWRYQSLFSDCFPPEQDSFHSKCVMGFCFSRQHTREGLQKPQGLRANSCSSALPLCFLPHYTGSCLGLKKPSLHSSLHYRLPEKWDVDVVSLGCQQCRGSSSFPLWIQQNGGNQWTSRYNSNVVGNPLNLGKKWKEQI